MNLSGIEILDLTQICCAANLANGPNINSQASRHSRLCAVELSDGLLLFEGHTSTRSCDRCQIPHPGQPVHGTADHRHDQPLRLRRRRRLLLDALAIAAPIAKSKARAHAAGVPVVYANDNAGRWRSAPAGECGRVGVHDRTCIQAPPPPPCLPEFHSADQALRRGRACQSARRFRAIRFGLRQARFARRYKSNCRCCAQNPDCTITLTQ
ncbi:hypothetical protein J2W32_005985 [Variovorax boronicumulans]|uniref:Uncharacterized protein n=1 Tax=Variovorax boronicumulans TaxID=436515 RepID=A0AAW8DBQ8_9BURK|nr:hypothetical protein [Variovorax boronicumulans]MDQ0056911.1 hypothetical protein [Variovorax boronicumulans]